MTNIRKIIEERLENARNDFLNAINNGKSTNREIGELQYTVLTYQDCLNLIDEYTPKIVTKQLSVKEIETLLQDLNKPHQFIIDKPTPRTEQEILKDFEKLEWVVSINDEDDCTLRVKGNPTCAIWIDKLTKEYSMNCCLEMQEHKLLNELFICWGWL